MNFTFKIVQSDIGLDEFVTPDNAEQLEVEYYNTDGQKYIRQKLNAPVILSDSDYRLIYPLLVANKCSTFTFNIYRSCDDTLFYSGLFTYFNLGTINESDCVIEFKVDTNDLYRTFLNKWKDEVNILNTNLLINGVSETVNPSISCNMDVIYETEEITYETYLIIYQADSHQALIPIYPAGWDTTSLNDFFPMTDDFQLSICDYQRMDNQGPFTPGIPVVNMNSGGTGIPFATFYCINTKRREILYIPEVDGTWTTPPVVIPAWTQRGTTDILGNTNKKYSRPYTYSTGNETVPVSAVPVFHWLFRLISNTDINFNNCRRLRAVIDYMLQKADLTSYAMHTSSFFYDEVNPVTQEAYFQLKYLLVGQKTDFIYNNDLGSLPSDKATIAMWTLEKCLNTLRDLFNVYWYIDGTKLRLEHELYFNNGLTYNATNEDAYLIDPDYVKESNIYSIDYSKYIGREIFAFTEADGVDFIGLPIKYLDCVPDLSSSTERTVNEVTTDIAYVYNSDTNGTVSDKGLVLLKTRYDFNASPKYHVENEQGIIAPTKTYTNGHLTWARLQDRYWKCGVRLLSHANVNGANETLPVVEKTKIQEQISFPLCCQQFNPYNLVKINNYDTAKMRNASFKLETEMVTFTLAYDNE